MLRKFASFFCAIILSLPTIAFAQQTRPRPPDKPPTGTATPREPQTPANPPQNPPPANPSPGQTSGLYQAPPPNYQYWANNPYSYMYPFGFWYMPQTNCVLLPDGSVRLKVKPNNAEVYIDGGFVGYVDNFDGRFQSLRLKEGFYKLEIKVEGYKSAGIQIRIFSGHKIVLNGQLIKK